MTAMELMFSAISPRLLDEIKRPVISAQLLARLGVERGMSVEECLHGTAIRAGALASPRTEIGSGQELRLIRNLLERLGIGSGLGLDIGLRYHLSNYGMWGFALLSSPTLRRAAEFAVSYLDLSFSFCRLYLEPKDRDLWVVFDDRDLPPDIAPILVERDFAAWANAAWEMRPGGFPARAAQFRTAAPAYAWRFQKIAGTNAHFNSPRNAVLLDAESLDAPLPQANPQMARLCEEQCRQLLARRSNRGGFAGQVRDRMLEGLAATVPTIEAVAIQMNTSSRSIRRRLIAEGTSFRKLLDEVREAVAEELLLSANLKLSDVAERVGYAESAPFIAAFRRWKGTTPSLYRRQARGEIVEGVRGPLNVGDKKGRSINATSGR